MAMSESLSIVAETSSALMDFVARDLATRIAEAAFVEVRGSWLSQSFVS